MRFDFCVACQSLSDLNHHHLMPPINGGSDDETNLITLCRPCHGKAHGVEWALGHAALIKAGQARARAEGRIGGRPGFASEVDLKVKELRDTGMSHRKISKAMAEQGYMGQNGKPISRASIFDILQRCPSRFECRPRQRVDLCALGLGAGNRNSRPISKSSKPLNLRG